MQFSSSCAHEKCLHSWSGGEYTLELKSVPIPTYSNKNHCCNGVNTFEPCSRVANFSKSMQGIEMMFFEAWRVITIHDHEITHRYLVILAN